MAKPATRRAIGRSFLGGTAIIIMRDTGQVITKATVLDKTFKVDTPDQAIGVDDREVGNDPVGSAGVDGDRLRERLPGADRSF